METIQYQKRIVNGYINILTDNGWIAEHRFIAEKVLNRPLKKEERIHHIDFNKKNNNPSNLALFSDENSHAHFHRQIKQFGMTIPRLRQIEQLKIVNIQK